MRERAEQAGTTQWKRPIHIGHLSIRLFTGNVVVDDFAIEGLTPEDRPFFTAKHLLVTLDWSTLLNWSDPIMPEITITAVDMADWQMLVERWNDRTNFVRFTDNEAPQGPKRFVTTLRYLRASRGQFSYEDHESPWSIVARNVDLNIGNLPLYHGTATFNGPSTLSWSGDQAAGASATVTYQVRVGSPPAGNQSLRNVVSSTTPGTNCPAGGSDRMLASSRDAFIPPPNSRPGCRSGMVIAIPPVAGLITFTLLRVPERSSPRR